MYGNAFRPGFDSGLPYRGAGPCCDACAVGDACTGCGPELGAPEGCQTGACPIPGGVRPMNDTAAGEVFDAAAAYRQARRVGARAAGDVDMTFTQEEAGEAQWQSMTPAQREAFLRSLGQRSGLSEREAREFALRERTADYDLIRGLVGTGAGIVRQLSEASTREEIERIRNNARVQAARFGMETNAEGEFLNIFRQSQGQGQGQGNNFTSSGSRSGGGGLAVAALLALALMGGKGRR